MTNIYLSLGSNLGDREENLRRALDALEHEGIRIQRRSALYETEPRDVPDQPWFLNLAAACETSFSASDLLFVVQRIERKAGRRRGTDTVSRGPRVLDIDILLFNDTVVDTPELTIPHPRMLERRFVLEPLVEIAPDLHHPATNKLFSEYLNDVAGQGVVRLVT